MEIRGWQKISLLMNLILHKETVTENISQMPSFLSLMSSGERAVLSSHPASKAAGTVIKENVKR